MHNQRTVEDLCRSDACKILWDFKKHDDVFRDCAALRWKPPVSGLSEERAVRYSLASWNRKRSATELKASAELAPSPRSVHAIVGFLAVANPGIVISVEHIHNQQSHAWIADRDVSSFQGRI